MTSRTAKAAPGRWKPCATRSASARVRLHLVPPVAVNGLVCSSTKVREFVLEGRVEAANMLLGTALRPGRRGRAGRGPGAEARAGPPPTSAPRNELLPAVGVYAVRARLLPGGPPIGGAANLGLNPTFRPEVALAGAAGRPPLSLEVYPDGVRPGHLRDARCGWSSSIACARSAGSPASDALKAQIAADVAQARRAARDVGLRRTSAPEIPPRTSPAFSPCGRPLAYTRTPQPPGCKAWLDVSASCWSART